MDADNITSAGWGHNSDDVPVRIPSPKNIFFSWWLTDVCQYRCTYCYAADFLGKRMLNDKNLQSTYKSVLSRLNMNKTPEFEVELLGGEPTTHPHLKAIVESLRKNKKCKDVSVVTNLTRSVDYFKDLDKLDEHGEHYLSIVPTYHPEYHDVKFIEKCRMLRDTMVNVEVSLNINLDPNNKSVWPKTTRAINLCEQYDLDYGLNPLQSVNRTVGDYCPDYTEEFWDTFSPYMSGTGMGKVEDAIPHTINGKEVMVSEAEIFKYNLNRFKGWECTPLMYTIGVDGNIYNTCTNDQIEYMLTERSLVKKVSCPLQECNCTIKWQYKKCKHE